MYLTIYPFIYLSISLSIYQSIHWSFFLFIILRFNPYISLSTIFYLSICLSICICCLQSLRNIVTPTQYKFLLCETVISQEDWPVHFLCSLFHGSRFFLHSFSEVIKRFQEPQSIRHVYLKFTGHTLMTIAMPKPAFATPPIVADTGSLRKASITSFGKLGSNLRISAIL